MTAAIRKHRAGTRAAAVVLWLAVVLLAAEGAVRAVGWVLRRDQDLTSTRPGAEVLYAIGDSFTYGQGVAPEQAWPRVLATRLQREGGGSAPVVRTLAEPGRSSSVAMLEVAKALKAGDARLLLILTGWNANDGDFAAFAAEHDRPVPWTARADLLLSHSRLYRVGKQALTYRSRTLVLEEVEVIPQTTQMQLYDFRAYQMIARANLQRIARLCHAAGVPCALLSYPHQELPPNPYTRTEYYHALFGRTPLSEDDYLVHDRRPGEIAIDAIIREVGHSEGVPVIDLQPAFAASDRHDLFLADWHHPTAAGHALIADTVFAAIRSSLGLE
jgi:lysophospholipase L1-like esterase